MGPAFGHGSDSIRQRERSRPQLQLRTQPQYQLLSPEAVSEEPQGFRRYQTRMGPRAPSPVPQRGSRRARPSKRARTSEPGESSSSRPQPSPVTSAIEATSSPQLSPASRIRRPLFVGNPIPGNVRLHRRGFHQESYYDVLALTADPRFRNSMRLIEDYSLLPFMTPRQYYYPRVVLQFYHSMTSRGAAGPPELQFSIDDRPGVLRAADISAALGLRIPPANSEGYQNWAHPPQREMVRILARDITVGPVLFRRQLPPEMLLIDYLLRTSLFPLQHYVQRRGAILEALYRISEGYWFSPSELVMTSLMHFEEKVHRKGLVRADSLPLLMPRLLCQVLEHMGFPEEPRIEMRVRCPLVLSMERVMAMPISFILQQQDQEEVPAPEPEVERSPAPHVSPPSPQPHATSTAAADTPGPSFAGVCSCQFARDRWCDGCYFLIGSYSGSPGSEVGSVSLHVAADYDSPGSSSCSGSERGAHYNSSLIGRFGSSSSSYRPTTTTAVRWLGFFFYFV